MAILNKTLNYRYFLFLLSVLGVVALSTASANAQPTDRFGLYYQAIGDADDVSASSVSGHIGHQFLLDEDGTNLLTASLRFSQLQLEDETLTGPDRQRDLQTIVADFNFMRVLNDEYSLVLSFRPGYYGELDGSLGDAFRVEGGFVITKFVNSNLTLGLGAGRGTNLGRDLIVPLFQFVYFASDKIVIRGLLPINASAWYIPNQKWEFGLVFRLDGSLYNIEETNIAGARQLGFASAHLGLSARYRMFGNNFLSLEAGITATRRYEWTDDRGASFNIAQDPFQEREIGNAPYVSFGWTQKF